MGRESVEFCNCDVEGMRRIHATAGKLIMHLGVNGKSSARGPCEKDAVSFQDIVRSRAVTVEMRLQQCMERDCVEAGSC